MKHFIVLHKLTRQWKRLYHNRLVFDDSNNNLYILDEDQNEIPISDGGGSPNVQSDWNESDNTSDAYIKNKPTIPTDIDD